MLPGAGPALAQLAPPASRASSSAHSHTGAHIHPQPARVELHGQGVLPDWVQHLWLLEVDVAWTGSLLAALASTVSRNNSSSGGGQEPDYVAFNTERADAGWRWFQARNWEPPNGLWRSYRHAARYSTRLLRAVAEAMRAGRVQSDEATGPTVCAANAGCVIDASWQPGHPVLGTDRMTGEAMYRWELLITPERWAALEAADAAELARCRPGSAENMVHQETAPAQVVSNCSDQGGWLYHKIKW